MRSMPSNRGAQVSPSLKISTADHTSSVATEASQQITRNLWSHDHLQDGFSMVTLIVTRKAGVPPSPQAAAKLSKV